MADLSHTVMDAAEEMAFAAGIQQACDQIAAYLDREADKTPRARVRARTLRAAASNIRAGLWRDER